VKNYVPALQDTNLPLDLVMEVETFLKYT